MDFTTKPATPATTPLNAQEMYGPKKDVVTDKASRRLAVDHQKKLIDSRLARLYEEAGNNPAKIQQISDLQSTRAGLTLQEKPKVTVESAQDVQKATPYTEIGEGGWYKGPEAPVGPATEQEVASAAPYMREGRSGFFKEPGTKAAPAVPAKAAPAVPAKAAPAVPAKAAPAVPAITSSPTAVIPQAPIEKATVVAGNPPAVQPLVPISEKKAQEIVENNPNFDWKGAAKKFGVSLLELVNAFALGEAGVTNPEALATTQRLGREAEDKKLEAAKAQSDKELAANQQKDELDRQFQAEQNRIQNQFALDRDAKKAETDKAAAEKEYQYRLGEIQASLKADVAKADGTSQAKAPEWVKNAMAIMKQKQAAGGAK